jgi:hypothetical protein
MSSFSSCLLLCGSHFVGEYGRTVVEYNDFAAQFDEKSPDKDCEKYVFFLLSFSFLFLFLFFFVCLFYFSLLFLLFLFVITIFDFFLLK